MKAILGSMEDQKTNMFLINKKEWIQKVEKNKWRYNTCKFSGVEENLDISYLWIMVNPPGWTFKNPLIDAP